MGRLFQVKTVWIKKKYYIFYLTFILLKETSWIKSFVLEVTGSLIPGPCSVGLDSEEEKKGEGQ